MTTRLSPYVFKPSELIKSRISAALTSTMYLIQQIGPTVFVVKERDDEQKYKVWIGTIQQCSCKDREKICRHVLYVMIKVLGVSPSNPLVWQTSLLDSEVASILSPETSTSRRRRRQAPVVQPFLKKNKGKIQDIVESPKLVQRQELVPDEVCAICQEDMVLDDIAKPLTFCKHGCGNNFHLECSMYFFLIYF